MKSSGNMIISVICVILVSFTGISLLTFSFIHDKIAAARTKKVLQTDKIFQDLIYHLHHFREKVLAENIAEIAQPEIDYFNETVFPAREIDGTLIGNSFSYRTAEKEGYRKIRITGIIDAEAADCNYAYRAGVDIDLLSGQVPLTELPVFINKKIDSPVDTFLKENKITSKDGKKIIVAEIEAVFDMREYLKEVLGIDKARLLSWETIREAFGFEVSSEPIADGIHILWEGDTVKLIFVQGDVERIIFSAGDSLQEIGIRKNGVDYLLSYEPGGRYFQCWDSGIPVYSLFKEKIVVNGNAWSIEQSGEGAFLPGSNIVLQVSRLAIIKTSLVTRDIDLKTIDLSHLTLLCGSKGMPGQDNLESGVVIDVNEEAAVQANIIVDGKVTNNSARLNLSGSLYAVELENKGVIESTHLDSKFDADRYFAVNDFKYISDFLINFIEEVYDEVK